MKKLISFAIAFVVLSLSFVTSVYSLKVPCGYRKVDYYIDGNLSFIAPSPINYTLVPIYYPHEIYVGREFFRAIEYQK